MEWVVWVGRATWERMREGGKYVGTGMGKGGVYICVGQNEFMQLSISVELNRFCVLFALNVNEVTRWAACSA